MMSAKIVRKISFKKKFFCKALISQGKKVLNHLFKYVTTIFNNFFLAITNFII